MTGQTRRKPSVPAPAPQRTAATHASGADEFSYRSVVAKQIYAKAFMPGKAGSRALRTAVVIGDSHRRENPWSGAIRAKPRRSRAKRAGATKSVRQDAPGSTQTLRSIS